MSSAELQLAWRRLTEAFPDGRVQVKWEESQGHEYSWVQKPEHKCRFQIFLWARSTLFTSVKRDVDAAIAELRDEMAKWSAEKEASVT